jgi:hypothetical protein
MLGQRQPKFGKSFNLTLIAIEFCFELVGGVDINDDGQPVGQYQIKCVVEIA